MGNRGTVIFIAGERISPAIYLHWNGSADSVYPFLAELERREVRADADYEAARFCQLVGEFMDQGRQGGLSLGIVSGPRPGINGIGPEELSAVYTDHGDNGFFLVDRSRGLVRRFLERWDAEANRCVIVEQTPEWVAQERADANMDYQVGIADYFAELASVRERISVSE